MADIEVGVAEGTVGDAGTLADWKQNSVEPSQNHPKTQRSHELVGLREKLQETIDFSMKCSCMGFSCNFSLTPIN